MQWDVCKPLSAIERHFSGVLDDHPYWSHFVIPSLKM